ncbi:helix-turn-helix domain-containing protein [Aeromicrobium sp. Root344]|uniref:helix-turn-helix domain-containing protein n=1 Tax=Aeromicrobium sp. Root344 TaxID=1736521 RepID=UPI0009E8865C|nr:helix-turn-helix transcriptional regulator [Aeromicrobium sp. Root344]
MDKKQAQALGKLLRLSREKAGLSGRELADRSGMAASNVLRLEQGTIANPRPETLKSLADVLDLDLSDLYAAAGYIQPEGLPSFAPYLRSKYSGLPASAQRELETSFAKIAAKHGYDPNGPQPGEDETE